MHTNFVHAHTTARPRFAHTVIKHDPPQEDCTLYRARKRNESTYEFRTDVTYTFSFNTGVFDLPAWKLHRLPIRDIWLSSFWGDSFLRFVAYEDNAGGGHVWRENRYILCAAVRHTPRAE